MVTHNETAHQRLHVPRRRLHRRRVRHVALAHLRHDAAQRLLGDGCGRWEGVGRLRALHLVRIPAAGPTGTSLRNRVQATVLGKG